MLIFVQTSYHLFLNYNTISKIEKIDEIHMGKHSDLEVCLTCPLAKFTKLPYPVSQSRVKQVFDLVHIDSWGSYRASTRGANIYFLTVVDDHTKITWVHLLKQKSDAFVAIETFLNMAKVHFEKQVTTLRCDNACLRV